MSHRRKIGTAAVIALVFSLAIAALVSGCGGSDSSPTATSAGPVGSCSATAANAAELRSLVSEASEETVCTKGDVGDVDLTGLRPAQPVAVRGRFGAVALSGSANLTVEGRFETVSAAGTSAGLAEHLTLRDCQGGGEADKRLATFAVVDLGANIDGFTIEDCDIGWTSSKNGEDGFGIRAVNGEEGPIRKLKIERSYLHGTANDAIQLAGVSGLTVDRTEIAYVGADYIDWHADPIQILSLAGRASDNVFSNDYIHHTGYLDASGKLAVNGSAGQWIWEPSGSGAIVRNNLIVDNRNYALNWYGQVGEVTLEHNTIVDNGTAFGEADSIQWEGGGGKDRVARDNIIEGLGGGEGVVFSGNVWTRGEPRSPSDIAQPVTFDAKMDPTDLPASNADAGYRKPGP